MLMRNLLIILFVVTLCAFNPFPAYSESKPSILIPIHDLMQDPLVSQVRISPDGNTIAALYNNNDQIVILIKDLTSNDEPVFIDVENHDVKWLMWKSSERLMAGTLLEKGLWEDYYALVVMDKNGKNMHHLLSSDSVGSVIDMLPSDPDHVLVEELSFENREFPAVYKVPVEKFRGEKCIQHSMFNVHHWMTDANGNVKMGIGWLPKKTIIQAKMEDGSWKIIHEQDYVKDPLFAPLGIGKSGIAYVLSRHENDKASLYEYDIETQTFGRQLFKHELVDLDSVFYSRLKDTVEFVSFTTDRKEIHFFEEGLRKDYLSACQALSGADNAIVSFSEDERRMIIYAREEKKSGSYYLFDRDAKNLTFLGSKYPSLEKTSLSEPKSINYKARDGMTIYGYLSLPSNFNGSTPFPMVVLVHGGPYTRDTNRFDPWVQFLTNRGYIVFQPNFRGSFGYGEAFWKSSYKQWGLAMEDDVIDGVQALIENKIADKNGICIMGASYGGYAALMGVAKFPDMFCCAVSVAGVTDINKFLIAERMKGKKNYYYNHVLIGDDSGDRKDNSPITHADRISCPVFLAHGTDDETVYFSHSNNMYKALKKEKKDVTFLKLKDETHQLEDIKNRVKLFKAIEKFLNKNMKL